MAKNTILRGRSSVVPAAPVAKVAPEKVESGLTEKAVAEPEELYPEKPLPKVTVSLYGRGGVVKINDPEVTPETRVGIKFESLPSGVTIGGIESFDGYFNVRWYASDNVNALVNAKVTL